MLPPRKYGNPPYEIVLIHGGPGAPGGMAPVANLLCESFGVFEPFQNAGSIGGQIEELKLLIKEHCAANAILIGHSWGAWLAWMFTSKYPGSVKKLIMIGAVPFEEKYAANIMLTRLNRLNRTDRTEVLDLMNSLQDKNHPHRKKLFEAFGILMTKADTFAPISAETHVLQFQPGIFHAVWSQANALRGSGKLPEMGKAISCPVVSIHGDYDPHPVEGVEKPLSKILENFKMIRLEKCGHYPWNEKFAREQFFRVLMGELS